MLKKLLCTFAIILSAATMVFSQDGSIQGKIMEKENPKESVPIANIVLIKDGNQVASTVAGMDGEYAFQKLEAGTYTIKVTHSSFAASTLEGLRLSSGQSLIQNFLMEPKTKDAVVIKAKQNIVEKGKTTTGDQLSRDEIAKIPGRDAGSIVATMAGVGVGTDGAQGDIRGMRSDGQVTIVDGVKMHGTAGIPKGALQEVQLMVGGIPAKYGEATSGVISIVTRGAAREFGGQVELMTTEPFDRTNNNLLEFVLTGPIIKGSQKESALFGFFLSGGVSMRTSPDRRYEDYYRVKSDVRSNLEQNPYRLRQESNGSYNLFPSASYLREDDFETFRYFTNSWSYSYRLTGRLDMRTTENTNLSVGGMFNYGKSRGNAYGNQVLNADNTSETVNRTGRIYARFIHRIPDPKPNLENPDKKPLLTGVYYQINGGFTNTYSSTYHPDYKDDLFKYGHVGTYTTHSTPTFNVGSAWVKNKNGDSLYYDKAWLLNDWTYDTLITYKPSEYNTGISKWMQQYYSFFPVTNSRNTNSNQDLYDSYESLSKYGAILNGGGVPGVYTFFNNVYAPTATNYGYSNTNYFDFKVDVSGNIKGHQIELGLAYDQQVGRSYSVGAYGLWTLMRQLQNRHIGQLDLANGWVVPGSQFDTIYYGLKDDGSQSTFDKNLREKLGMVNSDGVYTSADWLDIDSYSPDVFSLDMFSVEDLLNEGTPYVGYAGYDAWGKKVKGQASFDEFFKTGSNRIISARSPIMMSAYIQDKFVFEELIFNIGVRFDRFDNNTWVLKDPYLMYDAKTVAEVGGTHPGNIGSDYVVYVDDPTLANPTIRGYRNEGTWYNKDGIRIDDSELKTIAGKNGDPMPYLTDPSVEITKEKNFNAFKDYEPQMTASPRLAFSFPISDEAVFLAHYDIVTKRPGGNGFPYMAYLYMEDKYASELIGNPDLKFERTTDYEVGFQQKLGNSSALKFVAYYKEVRDLIQSKVVNGAYPKTYYTYGNLDFLTIKGLTLNYDLRQSQNITIRANYTLQFASGTGSDASSQATMVRAGYPNLRTLSPLNNDQRHMVKLDFDLRFADGKAYNGPVKLEKILQNAGAHLTAQAASGTPYTKREGAVARQMKGELNGARNPWQFYVDARFDKFFPFELGKDGSKKKQANLQVYVEIFNLLNIKNIPSVDAVTGTYNDDGRLEDPQFQATIEAQTDPTSYVQLYQMFINDSPYSLALPIRARLGFVFNF